ncbi:LysR family transcriptional regulator [Candidimonas humi]|uniref:LysR family transcriptional regulator n=1 Tax=Candidimonas humi TaxID=683355 RepID=A0ABV8P1U7_9BURK|nr:LysR family transcriptional regulator [Candidimonas humi]MBV6306786.1 LysR family transcriptional regulator [Candidimonas humi]
MNLKALRVFRSIVLQGSLAAAAERMHMSQSAASRLVGLLEAELKITLFSRSRRKLVLTLEGEMFYQEVEQVLGGIDEMQQIAADIRHRTTEKFTFVTSPPLGASLAVPAITRMRRAHSGFECRIHVEGRFDIENKVARRRFSLGLISLPVTNAIMELDVEPVFQARVGVLLPRAHALAEESSITAAQLAQEPVVTLQGNQLWRRRLDEVYASAGITPHIAIESTSTILVQQLVREGNGISLIDRGCLYPVPDAELVLRPLVPERWVTYGCIYPVDNRPPLADLFLKCLREHLRALARAGAKGDLRILKPGTALNEI